MNIITPENKTYLAPMSGYYPATYGFENDMVGSDPAGWNIFEGAGYVNVKDEMNNHKSIVEMYDNTNANHDELHNSFSLQTNGAVEFWVLSDDVAQTFSIIILDDTATSVWGNGIGWLQIYQNKFRYEDNAGWHVTTKTLNDNIWYHVKVEFECSTGNYHGLAQDTWRFYVDGEEFGDFSFAHDINNVSQVYFATRGADNNYKCYVDAVGYSWDLEYNIGDNTQEGLLLSFNTFFTPDWLGYSLDGLANKTILGNVTFPIPEEGVHTIQIFGNDTIGTLYQSEVRYFTTSYYPEVSITSPMQYEFFGNTAPSFVISLIESNIHSTWYNLNNGVNVSFSGLSGIINQTEWDKLINGSITIRFFANDTWGLEGYNEVSVWKDTYTPTSSILFIPHSGIDIANESTEFSLTADDGLGSGVSFIRYRINDSSWITYSTPFTLASYPYGDFLISYQSVDQVGNYESVQTLVVHRTETIAPTSLISFTTYRDPDMVIRSTAFTITADDGLGSGISLIRYKINNSIWFDYLGPFNLSNYDYGEYIIIYQAIDVVGNIEVEHGITVILIPDPSEPGILGYHLYIMICIISIVSAIIIKRRFKNKS